MSIKKKIRLWKKDCYQKKFFNDTKLYMKRYWYKLAIRLAKQNRKLKDGTINGPRFNGENLTGN